MAPPERNFNFLSFCYFAGQIMSLPASSRCQIEYLTHCLVIISRKVQKLSTNNNNIKANNSNFTFN